PVVADRLSRGSGLLLFPEKALVAPMIFIPNCDVPLRTVENGAHCVRRLPAPAHAGFVISHPMANFEYQNFFGASFVELAAHVENVRRFLVIVKHHVAANGADLLRILHAQTPAGDIELMNTLVPEVAIAVVPKPAEVVMKAVPGEGMLRRWTQPEIVVHSRRNRLHRRM